MYTAAELLSAVEARYRRRFALHADRAFGEFPPTWRQWFLSIEARPDAVTGAPAADWVDIFASRPLRPPPKATPPLSRARALRALMRTGWDPALREERGLRALSATLSAIAHVVLLFVFFWAALIRVAPLPSASDPGDVTVVEFIGEGTPETPGDAAPVAAMEEAQRGQPASAAAADTEAQADAQADAAAESAAAASASADSPPDSEAASVEVAAQPVPADTQPPSASEPADVETPAPPQAAQPLAVTETPVPDSSFTLPSTTLRIPQRPAPALPPAESAAPSREIPLVDRSTPAAPILPLPRRPALAGPEAPAPVPRREIPLAPRPAQTQALPLPQARRVAVPDAAAPSDAREIVLAPRPQTGTVALPVPGASQQRLPETQTGRAGQAREIPLRAPAAASGGEPAAGTASAGAAREGAAPAGRPDTDGSTARGTARTTAPAPAGRPGGTARSGAGPRPASPPGGLPAPVRGDDWGVSDRDRPGSGAGRESGPGLFNGDGSVRLPGDGGRVGGGLPPGTITEDFEKIDRMGTWLRRPPVDYTPSRFDKIFVPSESLLEEWVRKNVREVFVPIPGTGKRLRCVVSVLQAAGGCTIDDPNLRDQEAEARPPPAVPYKPELQDKE